MVPPSATPFCCLPPYGVGHAEPPMNPPPLVGNAAVALPVGVTPLLALMKVTTAAVSPAVPRYPGNFTVVAKRWRTRKSVAVGSAPFVPAPVIELARPPAPPIPAQTVPASLPPLFPVLDAPACTKIP